jgi:hypothetical protein
MPKKKKRVTFTKVVDDTVKIPEKAGNGTLKIRVSVDKEGELGRYSLTYINHRLCSIDNGRILGYDNSHGYHHRHYMGKEEAVEFESYEAVADQFDKEWRVLHEKAKKLHC